MKTKLFTLLCSGLLGMGSAYAASITWTAGTSFYGDNNQNNISLEGTLIRAVNVGGNAGDLAVTVDNGTTSETITFVDVNDLLGGGAFFVPSPETGDANWNTIIARADYEYADPAEFSLIGLTVGQEYQVEFFVADARNATIAARTFAFNDGAGNSSATNRQDAWVSVIGTFTADATSQTIQMTQSTGAPSLNAYVLRSIGAAKAQLFLTPLDQLDINLIVPATLATGTVDAAFTYGSDSNNVEITAVNVVTQQHANAFSVIGFSSPLTLTDPAVSETLNIQFDGTGMALGDTSTGLVEVVWNEVGGVDNTNTLQLVAAVTTAGVSWSNGSIYVGSDNQNNISLEGLLVRAVNFGGTNDPALSVLVDNGTKSETITFENNNDTFALSPFRTWPVLTTDANWNSIIDWSDFEYGAPLSFDIPDLIPGQEYQIEFFAHDNRGFAGRTFSFADDKKNSSPTNAYESGMSVIGTFKAETTSQTFLLSQGGVANPAPNISAYVLRALGIVEARLSLAPADQLDIVLDVPATQASGTVDVTFEYGTANTNVLVTSASVIDQQYSNTFSVVGFTPLTLTDPAVSETLTVQFDISGTNLASGATATGLVAVVWNEVGGDSHTNTLPVSALVRDQGVVWTDGLSFVGGTNQNNISLEGTLIKAVNLGGNAGNLSVLVDNGTQSETITFVDNNDLFTNDAYSCWSAETGDTNWNAIIDRGDWNDGDHYPFTITGLTVGQEYQIELFVRDARWIARDRIFTFSDDKGNTSAAHSNYDGISVIGTFTAKATTQTFIASQNAGAPTVNAYVLRALGDHVTVPWPFEIAVGEGGNLNISVSDLNGGSYTLQGTESLDVPEWYDMATTSGVTEVEWIYTPAKTVEFMRVVSP